MSPTFSTNFCHIFNSGPTKINWFLSEISRDGIFDIIQIFITKIMFYYKIDNQNTLPFRHSIACIIMFLCSLCQIKLKYIFFVNVSVKLN